MTPNGVIYFLACVANQLLQHQAEVLPVTASFHHVVCMI